MDPTTSPDPLVQAQHEWAATYQALASTGRPHGTAALRRRLILLSTRILRLRQQTPHSPDRGEGT